MKRKAVILNVSSPSLLPPLQRWVDQHCLATGALRHSIPETCPKTVYSNWKWLPYEPVCRHLVGRLLGPSVWHNFLKGKSYTSWLLSRNFRFAHKQSINFFLLTHSNHNPISEKARIHRDLYDRDLSFTKGMNRWMGLLSKIIKKSANKRKKY